VSTLGYRTVFESDIPRGAKESTLLSPRWGLVFLVSSQTPGFHPGLISFAPTGLAELVDLSSSVFSCHTPDTHPTRCRSGRNRILDNDRLESGGMVDKAGLSG